MGFRIRKSISLGKGMRLNLGKKGITSVSFGKRGAPHVTVGKGGTRFGTPVIPGTGISYETRLDKPSKKTSGRKTIMGKRQAPASMPRQKTSATTQMEVLTPTEIIQPPVTPVQPPHGGGNGGSDGQRDPKKPWYKRWWGMLLIVLLVIGVINAIFTPSKTLPDVVGQTAAQAKTILERDGFKQVTITPETKGGDGKWKVESQTPDPGSKQKTSTSITLTVKRDNADLPDIAQKGMMLDKVVADLSDAGYAVSDYRIESDTGKMVLDPSNWVVVSAADGVIRVHNKAADEEAARKAAEEKKKAEEEAARKAAEEKKKAEEEAARKAEEEKKAAEEQARQQAEQQAQQQAAEEAARQQQQQQQQSANTYYANCDAVRAAGAAPLYQGQPGYSTKLDRDRDGVACE